MEPNPAQATRLDHAVLGSSDENRYRLLDGQGGAVMKETGMNTKMRILPALLLFCIFAISLRADEGTPLAPAPAWTKSPVSWDSGVYSYDGAGNIKQIGNEGRYTYDALGRLKTSTASTPAYPNNAQTFDYDRYGNLQRVTTTSGIKVTVDAAVVNPSTNQLTIGLCSPPADYCHMGVHDAAGNQIGSTQGVIDYEWDALGMMTQVNIPTHNEAYVYDASDERIITVGKGGGSRRFTLRGADNKVSREIVYNPMNTTWTWQRDYVYRGGALLAAFVGGEAGAGPHRHYHLDHLGTPRLITDGAGYKRSIQTYWPFGAPAAGGDVDIAERMAFSGHELDSNPAAAGQDLYYMHARYYTALEGRFLSVDPAGFDLNRPQSWNRYSYVVNNPLNRVDRDGRADGPPNSTDLFILKISLGTEEKATLSGSGGTKTNIEFDIMRMTLKGLFKGSLNTGKVETTVGYEIPLWSKKDGLLPEAPSGSLAPKIKPVELKGTTDGKLKLELKHGNVGMQLSTEGDVAVKFPVPQAPAIAVEIGVTKSYWQAARQQVDEIWENVFFGPIYRMSRGINTR
jgi:RHS repeat-associated protein